MKKILFLLLLLTGKLCYAQTADPNVRPPFSLKLFVNDTTFYEAPMNATSFVYEKKNIQIFPGENLFIEADLAGDSLTNLRVVPEIIHKEKTLKVSFTQNTEGKIHKQMILNIANPFSKQLDYSAQINLMSTKKWGTTSVMPILPGLGSYEIWPDIITTIVLYNFHLKN